MAEIQISQEQMRSTMNLRNRQSIRQPKNPMDKCTIVSIYPKEIIEVKHTIEPGRFVIPAGSSENPAILVVGSSSWWKDIDAEQPLIEIPCGSVQIAESVVKDFCNGMLGCNMSDAMPGLFYVHGEVSLTDIKLKYRTKLKETEQKQKNWFTILVQLADSLWARSNMNPRSISDEMRVGANILGLDKPWLKDFKLIDFEPCFACGTKKDPEYPVCPMCRAIDPKNSKSKDIKFAVQ